MSGMMEPAWPSVRHTHSSAIHHWPEACLCHPSHGALPQPQPLSLRAPASDLSVISRFLEEYLSSTPQRLKLLDAYLLYILLTGALQFGYCLLVGTFPFNSFLSGFISCVGSFILAVCLRIQINPQNKADFQGISPERAFADFLFASTILHLVVMNFVG